MQFNIFPWLKHKGTHFRQRQTFQSFRQTAFGEPKPAGASLGSSFSTG
jgi:hypothetical protein